MLPAVGANEITVAMLRDTWWWPWWVSTLIDLGVVAIAAGVFFASSRRSVELIAGFLVLAGLIAAVLAPVVMTDGSDEPGMERMEPASMRASK
jgi:hypothetical protein